MAAGPRRSAVPAPARHRSPPRGCRTGGSGARPRRRDRRRSSPDRRGPPRPGGAWQGPRTTHPTRSMPRRRPAARRPTVPSPEGDRRETRTSMYWPGVHLWGWRPGGRHAGVCQLATPVPLEYDMRTRSPVRTTEERWSNLHRNLIRRGREPHPADRAFLGGLL